MAQEKIVIFHHDERGAVAHWSEIGELVRCKNCKYMTDCFSEVAMTDQYQLTTIFEPIEWCSKGERKEDVIK